MNTKRAAAAVAGALVAGVVMGSVVSGFAATPSTAPTSGVAATGLRLGATMRASGARLLDVVAKLTGQSTTEVVAQRQAGKTFTQIATSKNVSSAAVVAEALKVRQAVLAEKVKSGAITQAQADTALATMKTRLTTRVDSANPGCTGAGAGGAGGGCGAGGAGGGCGAGGAGGGCGAGGAGGGCGAGGAAN